MSAARKPKPVLTAEQARTVDHARKALETPGDKNLDAVERLAARVGALEWHVGELLALVEKLTGGGQ